MCWWKKTGLEVGFWHVLCVAYVLWFHFPREGSFQLLVVERREILGFCCGEREEESQFLGRRWEREGTYLRRATGGMCDPPRLPPQPPGLPSLYVYPSSFNRAIRPSLSFSSLALGCRGEGGGGAVFCSCYCVFVWLRAA